MIGEQIYNFAEQLWGINRSITGNGVRQTLQLIQRHLPNLKIFEVPTGSKVFDWNVPQEWNVDEAYIIDPEGNKFCDFKKNNLHLLGYSIPFSGYMELPELTEHLYTVPDQPDAIPYVTSYYEKRWGFALAHSEFSRLKEGKYYVFISTKHFHGSMSYGELIIPGNSKSEVFLSTYICHPSMANNELSGPVVQTQLGLWLAGLKERRYTYRLVFLPETIGSITYLSRNLKTLKKNVIAGFNITCVGDDRSYSYLPSRNGDTLSDRVAKHILHWTDPNYSKFAWLDRGSDERQYCSPGVDLPISSIMRTKYGEYPEYHTSLDDLNLVVTPKGLNGGYWALRNAIDLIEKNHFYVSLNLCEPFMSKRNLYPSLSTKKIDNEVNRIMDVLSYCDGFHSVIDIANNLNVPAWDLYKTFDKLVGENLIAKDGANRI